LTNISNNSEATYTGSTGSPAHFTVRCPDCYKAYSVESASITVKKPQFECQSCQTRFWVAYPDVLQSVGGVIGYPVEWKREQSTTVVAAADAAVYSCPKCEASYTPGQAECARCGIIFAKYSSQPRQEDLSKKYFTESASRELQDMWETVIAHYDVIEHHQNFISRALAEQSLEYASHKYALILELAPHDEMAKLAQTEILALAEVKFENTQDHIVEVVPQNDNVLTAWDSAKRFFAQYRSSISFRNIKITNVILVACGFIMTVGLFLPHMRNLIGFGASIMFFILILRFYFRAI
jgi:hypothetical protein